jgi:anti-sigma B factor antagonist
MDITTTLGPVSVLSITGNIDGSNFQQLVDKVDEMVQKGHTRLVLDFQGVPYLSSAGIVALQTILGRVTNQGGKLALTGVNSQIAQTFDIVGVTKSLKLYPDNASALASLGGADS